MTLGDLIKTMGLFARNARVIISAPLFMYPGEPYSYRGFYEQLAFEPLTDGDPPLVSDFLATLEAANGATFTGYKGGKFKMDLSTRAWISQYGKSAPWSARITGVTNLWDSYARIDWRKTED